MCIIHLFGLLTSILNLAVAQKAIGVKLNNPLFYGGAPGTLRAVNDEKIEVEGHWGIFNAGLFARFPLKKHWAVHTELLLKNERAKYTYTMYKQEMIAPYFAYYYLDVPILLQYEAREPAINPNAIRPFVQVGFSPKSLLKANYFSSQLDAEQNVYPYFNKVVFTTQIGGGVLWQTEKLFLLADMRISVNLTPVAGIVRGIDFSNGRSYSITFSGAVGYKLPLVSLQKNLTN